MKKKRRGCLGFTVSGALIFSVIRMGAIWLSKLQRANAYFDANGNYVVPGFDEIFFGQSFNLWFSSWFPSFGDILPVLLVCMAVPVVIFATAAISYERERRMRPGSMGWTKRWIKEEKKRRQQAEKLGLLREYERAQTRELVQNYEKHLARWKERLQELKELEKLVLDHQDIDG